MKKKSLIITLSLVLGFSLIVGGGFFLAKLKSEGDKAANAPVDLADDALEYANNETDADETSTVSPYTGEVLSDEQLEQDTFMCIIENSRQARPQSGLSQADFVYETMAEGGISRFLTVFNSSYVDKIGPIRSARYYFLDLIEEFNLPFAHCGGAADALDRISNDSSLKSINEMTNGKFFERDNSRVAPHNLYTSTDKLASAIDSKGFKSLAETRKFVFDDDFWNGDNLENCQNLELKLSHYYTTSYEFSENGYIKSMDGEECIDAYNNESLTFDNIIIQLTNLKTKDDERLDIELMGSGKAYVISNGKLLQCTWSKANPSSATVIKNEKGEIIPLSTGNTIWHIADESNEINFY